VVNESNFDIFYTVSKWAVLSVLTLLNFVRKEVTELCLVFVFVIKSFNSVVSTPASVFLRTPLCVSELAQLRRVEIIISPLVLDRMVVVAAFVVVSCIPFWTFNHLEVFQIQVLNKNRFSSAVVRLRQSLKDLVFLERIRIRHVICTLVPGQTVLNGWILLFVHFLKFLLRLVPILN
jgi:hypothetical protein